MYRSNNLTEALSIGFHFYQLREITGVLDTMQHAKKFFDFLLGP